MNDLKISRINRSLRKFMDYSQDVLQSDMNTFDDRVHLLMSYCKTDPVFSIIHNQLMYLDDAIFENWLAERKSTAQGMLGSGELLFPTNEDERISTMYWLLRKVDANEIEASNFATDFYATRSSSISEYIRFFTDTVVSPLRRDLGYRFEEMMEELPSDPAQTIPSTSIQIIHSAQNVIQQSAQGSNINQNADIQKVNELDRLFGELRSEIASLVTDQKLRSNAQEIVSEVEELALLNPPKVSAAKRLLSLLPTLGNIGSIAGGISALLAL